LIRQCIVAALQIALDGGAVFVDVRAIVPIPPHLDPKLVGTAFAMAQAAGYLRRDGWRRTVNVIPAN
jgi:hypothetical protein